MVAATFSCLNCGTVDEPTPCPCVAGFDGDFHCGDCGESRPFVEVAPEIWLCPGCVDMHRRRAEIGRAHV